LAHSALVEHACPRGRPTHWWLAEQIGVVAGQSMLAQQLGSTLLMQTPLHVLKFVEQE
jgi:hypothetical protein